MELDNISTEGGALVLGSTREREREWGTGFPMAVRSAALYMK